MLTRHDELLYVYAGYHQIPNVDTNGFWMFNLCRKLYLKEIKFIQLQLHYSKGNYFYHKPIRMLWI
jgi:hypothetical protein